MPAFASSIPTCRRLVERLLPADSPAEVAAVLGSRHPLTRACGLQTAMTRQVGVVGTLAAVCGGVAAASGARWAQSIALAACAVVPVLTVVLVLALRRVRAHVGLLVLKGLEAVPLTLVAQERARLLSPATRERAALRFESFPCERAPGARPDPAAAERHPRLGLVHSVHVELFHVAELGRVIAMLSRS